MIYSAYNEAVEGKVAQLQMTYAHGALEQFLGHQDLATDNVKTLEAYYHARVYERPAIINTTATNEKGETVSVIYFLWFNRTVRGLAVLTNDTDSIQYAEMQYNRLSSML